MLVTDVSDRSFKLQSHLIVQASRDTALDLPTEVAILVDMVVGNVAREDDAKHLHESALREERVRGAIGDEVHDGS